MIRYIKLIYRSNLQFERIAKHRAYALGRKKPTPPRDRIEIRSTRFTRSRLNDLVNVPNRRFHNRESMKFLRLSAKAGDDGEREREMKHSGERKGVFRGFTIERARHRRILRVGASRARV